VPRGGILASVRYLCERWRWSNSKVSLFLDVLEREGMIRREKRHGNSVIFLCAPDAAPQERRRKSDREPTRERQRGDEIEDGKDRKERKESRRAPASREHVLSFCEEEGIPVSDADWFWQKGQGNDWTNGGAPIRDWMATFRSWKHARYLPSQKAGGFGANAGSIGVPAKPRVTPLESLRKRAMVHGPDEFKRWMWEQFPERAEGHDNLARISHLALLTDFLRAKGERV
ncbi:MAG TPA: hypothetical protein VIM48_10450, partial [Chthoniobacterales bacterium]